MPHQCVRCSKLYPDGSEQLLKGCECGGKFFFYVREKNLKEANNITSNLTKKEKTQIEKDVKDIIGPNFDNKKPVILDLETVRIQKPGKYEIDLIDLFKGSPLVYKVEDGKYLVDIATTLKINLENKKEN